MDSDMFTTGVSDRTKHWVWGKGTERETEKQSLSGSYDVCYHITSMLSYICAWRQSDKKMIKTFMIRGESPSHTSSQRNHRSKRTAGHVKGAASLMEPKSSISARSTT